MIVGEKTPGFDADVKDRLDSVLSLTSEEVLDRMNLGHVNSVTYDTAWVARIPDPEDKPEFPETLEWLLANQWEDGSWGSEVFHHYDRFINTLAAAIALKRWNVDGEAVSRATSYLNEAVHELTKGREGVSSDHIVGLLMEEAQRVGLELSYEHSPHRPWNVLKRTLLSRRYVDPEHPLGFFIELLGRVPSSRRMDRRLHRRNGSIMCSPSATAASIVYNPDPQRDHTFYSKLRYIKSNIQDDGGVAHFWDQDLMNLAYGLYNVMHCRPTSRTFVDNALILEDAWTERGLSFTRDFLPADLDDTILGYRVLTYLGREPDHRVFDRYWQDDFFVTYTVHDRGQVGPNIHAVEALAHSSHPERDDMIQATVGWLRSQLIDGRYFVDEWNISPAYATSHAIMAFHMTEEALMERCVSYFLDTQHQDGSWGYVFSNGLGTLEETAYALQGLLYYHHNVEPIDEVPIRQGVEYILAHYPTAEYPPMWMAKVLYLPRTMVESAIVSSLIMYKRFVGGDYTDAF